MGPRTGLDRCGKFRPHRDSNPGPSSPWPVAIPTTLTGPLTPLYTTNILCSHRKYNNCFGIQKQNVVHLSCSSVYRKSCLYKMQKGCSKITTTRVVHTIVRSSTLYGLGGPGIESRCNAMQRKTDQSLTTCSDYLQRSK